MRKIIWLLLLFVTYTASAQLFKLSNDPVFMNKTGEVLDLALAGGLNQPQFSNMDFNNDGSLDLFVFDRTGNKVLTFISKTAGGKTVYEYEPMYEEYFPKAVEFMHLRDFDNDQKPDLWFYDNDSVIVFKNVSNGYPKFERIKALYALDNVNYVSWAPNKKLSQVVGCLPGIEDLDNDGDIDFVTNLNSSGSAMILFQNNTVDSSKSLVNMSFEIPDKCYGGIDEFSGYLTINSECLYREAYKKKKKHVATKTMLFLDGDNDGDYDLFYGSSEKSSNPIYYFENGKTDLGNYYKDTFVSIDSAYFTQPIENQIPIAPAMSYVDVDLDGEKDLILSTNETATTSYPIQQTENVLYFNNKGTTKSPSFDFVQNDFLVGSMIDFGAHSAPAFADLDNDGDQDLVLATNGDHYKTSDTAYFLVYFENIGSATDPKFQIMDENFLDVKSKKLKRIQPAFGDLNGDGLLDLILGKTDGQITFYQNTGSKSKHNLEWQTDAFQNIDAGENSAPCLFDINKDGLTDVLIGNYDGVVQYYKNTGTITNPSYNLTNDSFGGVFVNELVRQTVLTQNGFVDTFIYQYWGYSVPSIGYFKDSVMVLCVGGDQGIVKTFKVDQDLNSNFNEFKDYMEKALLKEDYTKDWGERVSPAAADLNGDGVLDLTIGNNRGGLSFLEGLPKGISGVENVHEKFFLAPNPSKGRIKIFVNSPSQLKFNITDLSGRLMQEGTTYNGLPIVLNHRLINGVYVIRLSANTISYTPQKLILFK